MSIEQDNCNPNILDFDTIWEAETPMQCIRTAENEIRQDRFENIFIVLHQPMEDGSSTFMILKNDMSFDAQAACSMYLMKKIMTAGIEEDD